jgi:Ca2+-binding RTX toxin-like protein
MGLAGVEESTMNFTGTNGDDEIFGSEGDDLIAALGGNDLIFALSGNDEIYDGPGIDTVHGGNGNDLIFGGDGDDLFYGDAGNDEVYGGAGNDSVYGGEGDDVIGGSEGDDILYGGAGNDQLIDSFGNNRLYGDDGDDFLSAGAGNDVLSGGAGFNRLFGGTGDDLYIIDSRFDHINDLAGNDTAIVNVDFVKVPSFTQVETWTYAEGVLPCPYWIDALINNGSGFIENVTNKNHLYYYCFPQEAPTYLSASLQSTFLAFNDVQKQFASGILDYISSIIDLKFEQTADPNQLNTITFINDSTLTSSYQLGGPGFNLDDQDIVLAGAVPRILEPTATNRSTYTYVHEIGHVIGLKHPFSHLDALGKVAQPPYLSDTEDNWIYTKMSYTGDESTFAPVFADFDIAALQYLYGPARSARAGDDVYVLRDDTYQMIWDGAGTDTIDGSALSQSLVLHLTPGYHDYIGSKTELISGRGQITINFGTEIENVAGGSAGDVIVGNDLDNVISGGSGNDSITGGPGNDLLDGGDGLDVAAFNGNRSVYTIVSSALVSGLDGTDTLANVERLQFFDKRVAFDLGAGQAGGNTVRIIGAAFDAPTIVQHPDYVAIGLDLFDSGQSMLDVCGLVIPILGLSNTVFVTTVFTNVVGRAPTASEQGLYVELLVGNGGPYTQAQLLEIAANSPINADNIDLVGLQQTGVEFV